MLLDRMRETKKNKMIAIASVLGGVLRIAITAHVSSKGKKAAMVLAAVTNSVAEWGKGVRVDEGRESGVRGWKGPHKGVRQ